MILYAPTGCLGGPTAIVPSANDTHTNSMRKAVTATMVRT